MLSVLAFPALSQKSLWFLSASSVAEGAGSRFFSALACDLTSSRGACWTVGHPHRCSPALLAGLPALWRKEWMGARSQNTCLRKAHHRQKGVWPVGPSGRLPARCSRGCTELAAGCLWFQEGLRPTLMEGTGGACNIFSQLRQKQKCLYLYLRPDLKFR